MNRIARRVVSTAVPALAAVVALGTPAHADAAATVTWYPGPANYVTIVLNDDSVSAARDTSGLYGFPIDELCGQIGGFVNSKRQAAGFTEGLDQRDCARDLRQCATASSSPGVEVDIFADLTYRCIYF